MLHFVFTFVTPKVLTVAMTNAQDFRDVMPCKLLHTDVLAEHKASIILYGLQLKMEDLSPKCRQL